MSDDCISRQAALDAIDRWCMGEGDEGIYTIVENLPSVTSKPIITNKSAVFWLENITEKYLKGDTFEDRQMKKSINKAIKALEQEPTDDATLKDIFCMGCEYKEQEPCEDAISRQAVLEEIDVKAWEFCDYLISKNRNDEQKPVSHFADNLRECIREDLPSVNPQEQR